MLHAYTYIHKEVKQDIYKEIKLEIRRLENFFLRLQRNELRFAFNRTCLKSEDILPKYIDIYIYEKHILKFLLLSYR